tara:strand:+ start:5894 stop:6379 length:486 start_codon:yes stop_codon:yes gene_type:complete
MDLFRGLILCQSTNEERDFITNYANDISMNDGSMNDINSIHLQAVFYNVNTPNGNKFGFPAKDKYRLWRLLSTKERLVILRDVDNLENLYKFNYSVTDPSNNLLALKNLNNLASFFEFMSKTPAEKNIIIEDELVRFRSTMDALHLQIQLLWEKVCPEEPF